MIRTLILAAFACAAVFGQTQAAADGPLKMRYASNLHIGDSVINMTNSAASNNGICVHVYAFTPDEQLSSCCSCYVTPNGLNSLSVRGDLASNPLTPIIPTSMVIKLYATDGSAGGGSCNAARPGTAVNGLVAWGTTLHEMPITPASSGVTYGLEGSAFVPVTVNANEITRISQLCGYIKAIGSGYGVCKSCRLGGLGASSK